MLKKKYFMLLLLLLFALLLGTFSSCYAYSISELESYLDYYKSEVDNGSTEFGNSYAIQQLYSLYANHYDQFLILNERLANCVNPVFRINNNTSNGNIYYKLMDCTSLSVTNNGGINATYTYYKALTDSRGVGNFSNSSGTSGSETIGNIYNILYSSGLIDSNMITTLNSSYNYITQKQWTFIVNRGGTSPIYTNNNQNVNVFDIRIGQDWNINNVSLRIYTFNNNSKEYRNNITYTLDNTSNTNQYLVRFDVTNLDEDNTYYIELYYNNNLWRDTETGQRVIKNSTPITPSGENSSGNIVVDLTNIENKIDFTNELLTQQTQAILSGDKQLRDSIISGDNKIIGALTNTNFSGDITLDDLPQVEIDDPSEEFFSWLLTNIEDVILYSGDSVLVIPIYDTQHEIRSDVFKLNMEPLKTFISIGWWFICGIPLLKWVRHTIETIRSGNIPQVDDKSDLLGNVL